MIVSGLQQAKHKEQLMHEYPVTVQIVDIASETARKNNGRVHRIDLVVGEDSSSVHGQWERSGDLLPFHHAFQHFPGKILQVLFFFFGAALGNGNIPEHGVFRIVFGAQIYAEPS